jgi:hypothetical protein
MNAFRLRIRRRRRLIPYFLAYKIISCITLVRNSLIWTISYNLLISYIKFECYNYLRSLILGKLARSNWLKRNFKRQIDEELQTLNVTKSIIPGGGTTYIQPLDDTPNLIVGHLIRDQEKAWTENNLEEWESGTTKLPKRRILMTH